MSLDEGGAVVLRRVRSTGTLVGVYPPGAQSDPDEGWQTICWGLPSGEPHGGVLGHSTRRDAVNWMSAPEDWCPACSGEERHQ